VANAGLTECSGYQIAVDLSRTVLVETLGLSFEDVHDLHTVPSRINDLSSGKEQ